MSSTRSATLAVSIIAPSSFGHSMMVNRRFLPALLSSVTALEGRARTDP